MKTWKFHLRFIFPLLVLAFVGFQPQDDETRFYLSTGKTFSPGEKVQVQLQSYNLSGRITLTLYRISDPVDFFLRQPSTYTLDVDSLNLAHYKKVEEWKLWIQRRDQWWNYQDVSLDIESPGVYLVEAAIRGKYAYTVVTVSRYAMILKRSPEDLVAFVVNKGSGKRVADFPLVVYRHGRRLVEGRTRNGVFHLGVKEHRNVRLITDIPFEELLGYYELQVMGVKNGNFVLSNPYYYSYGRNPKHPLYLFTERPVYRPNQEVYFKGILRNRINGRLTTPARTSVQLTISDTRNNEVHRDTLFTNDFGSFSGSFSLGEEPPLGVYTINAVANGEQTAYTFEVQEYKKPEYEVTVEFSKDQYASGELLNMTIHADYYFGSPVSGGEVEYSIYRSTYWRPWWRGTVYEWYYEDHADYTHYTGSERLHTGRGTLDAEGRLDIEYLTDASSAVDYVYDVQARVTDASRRMIAGRQSVIVARGFFNLTVRTDKYVYKPNEKIHLQVNASNFSGQGVPTEFSVYIVQEWYERYGRSINGEEIEEYRHHQGELITLHGETGVDGNGSITFEPTATGYYTFTVTADDSLGNTITEQLSVYVTDESYAWWGRGRSSAFQIIADKATYDVGDEIQALVIAPHSNLDVLVGIEAENLLEYRVERFKGTSKILKFKVKGSFTPNVYLSVSSLFKDNFYHRSQRVVVPPKEKFLQVEVLSDKDTYRPGEEGTLTVKVTDAHGTPVPLAELSLAVVDESIYAIAPEKTTPIQSFFYKTRYNSVRTSSSQYHYMYGVAKSARAMNLEAEMVAGAAVADGISFLDARSREENDLPQFVEAVIRREFKDLAYWVPSILTNEDGIATVQFRFPENLSTWRTTVRVITKSSEVGSAVSKTITRKDLLVRMETPRFFLEHDSLLITTTVHNYLNEDKKTKVIFTASGLEVEGTEQIISVPKNGERHVDWRVKPLGIGEAVLTVKALTNEESDAMEVKVPILPHGLRVAEAHVVDIGEYTGTKHASFTIPANANLRTTEIFINYSPSLASSILGALDDLIGYPYGCVEQTMSRFLPTVVVANTLNDLNVPMNPELVAEIPKMVEKGLGRLASMQHSDGGWGWWKDDETNPFMTAYVVYGLSLARRAQYEIDNGMYQRGVSSVKAQLEREKTLDPTTRAYMLYTLAFADERENVLHRSFFDRQLATFATADMNDYTKSLLALASYSQEDLATAYSLVGQIERSAISTGTSAYWSGKSWHYNWQDDIVETTAFALKALVNLKNDSELITKGVHWLLGQKQGASWMNTRQTAIVIFSLVDYLQNSKELEPDYMMHVFVNGKKVLEEHVTREELFSKEPTLRLDSAHLRRGENTVSVTKQGPGKLYFTSTMMYYSSEENIRPRSAGFQVERKYYRLVQRRYGNEIFYQKVPLRGVLKSGDEVFVEVIVRSDRGYEYFMLEDPLPAGVEVVRDTRGYKITGALGLKRGYYDASQSRWTNREVRDEKVSFFATRLSAGEHTFNYVFRAQIPGSYHVMPSLAALMYYPEVRGNSHELQLQIVD